MLEYNRIAMEPLECSIRKTGRSDILGLHEIDRVTEKIDVLLKRPAITGSEPDNMVFNPGESGVYGAGCLLQILSEVESAKGSGK